MKFFTLFFIIISNLAFSQTKEKKNSVTIATHFTEINTENLKSKSLKTPKATLIKLNRKKITNQLTVKQLLNFISDSCDVILSEITVKNGEQITTKTNYGNNILISINPNCKFILIDNLVSNCSKSHNANYKIIFE